MPSLKKKKKKTKKNKTKQKNKNFKSYGNFQKSQILLAISGIYVHFWNFRPFIWTCVSVRRKADLILKRTSLTPVAETLFEPFSFESFLFQKIRKNIFQMKCKDSAKPAINLQNGSFNWKSSAPESFLSFVFSIFVPKTLWHYTI
jgi:hypothetical protein